MPLAEQQDDLAQAQVCYQALGVEPALLAQPPQDLRLLFFKGLLADQPEDTELVGRNHRGSGMGVGTSMISSLACRQTGPSKATRASRAASRT